MKIIFLCVRRFFRCMLLSTICHVCYIFASLLDSRSTISFWIFTCTSFKLYKNLFFSFEDVLYEYVVLFFSFSFHSFCWCIQGKFRHHFLDIFHITWNGRIFLLLFCAFNFIIRIIQILYRSFSSWYTVADRKCMGPLECFAWQNTYIECMICGWLEDGARESELTSRTTETMDREKENAREERWREQRRNE